MAQTNAGALRTNTRGAESLGFKFEALLWGVSPGWQHDLKFREGVYNDARRALGLLVLSCAFFVVFYAVRLSEHLRENST